MYGGSRDLAFSSTKDNGVWVQLLEKAWAKANGGYDNIVFGLCSEVLRAITGAPTFAFDHDLVTEEDLWKQLRDGVRSDYTMLCSLDPEKYAFSRSEAVSNYSYTVVGAYKVDSSKGGTKLVKIRNPWNNFEWKGDWSDSSRLWTSRVKEEVEFEGSDKGFFYMSLQDYVANFSATVVCKVHDQFEHTKTEAKQDIGGHTIFKFQVNADSKVFLTASQLAYRIVRPYNAKMLLARLDKDNPDFPLEYINGVVDEKDEISLEADLIAGEYYLFAEVDWTEDRPHDSFVVSFYGPHAANLYEKSYPSFLEKALSS